MNKCYILLKNDRWDVRHHDFIRNKFGEWECTLCFFIVSKKIEEKLFKSIISTEIQPIVLKTVEGIKKMKVSKMGRADLGRSPLVERAVIILAEKMNEIITILNKRKNL